MFYNRERTSNAIGRFFVPGKNVIQNLHPSFDLVVYMQSMQNIQNMQKMQNMQMNSKGLKQVKGTT